MDNNLNLDHHISGAFNNELEEIRNKVLTMGGLVERQVEDGLTALLESDAELADTVAHKDYKINAMEVEIDEECIQILARRAPTASDLRLVVTVIKVITDLERIGDEAEKLGRFSAEMLGSNDPMNYRKELRHIGELVRGLLRSSLDAFARLDVDAALETATLDDEINREYQTLERLLSSHLVEDPRQAGNLFRTTWCARALERIGDHSVNICEYVVYLVKGRDIRHISMDQVRSELGSSAESREGDAS